MLEAKNLHPNDHDLQRSKLAISVDLLTNHPHLIPTIGEMRWREWGYAPEPDTLEQWVDITLHESGRDHLPVTWVAIDHLGQAVGAVGLDEFDPEERRDRSPWVVGTIVAVQQRGLGTGSQLMRALEAWAKDHSYTRLWVATGGLAVAFYQKCGWVLAETFNRSPQETVSILTKSL